MGRPTNPNRKTRSDYDYKRVRVFKPDGVLSTVSLQHWDYVRLMTVSRLSPEGFNRYLREVAKGVDDPGGNRWSKCVVEQLRTEVDSGKARDPRP